MWYCVFQALVVEPNVTQILHYNSNIQSQADYNCYGGSALIKIK